MQFKRFIPDLVAVLCFAAISLAYFFGPIRDGLVLTGHDHSAASGISVETEQYRRTHDGERTRWTGTLFCGMPTYQISPSYPSTGVLSRIESVYQLGLPQVAGYVFMLLLGFYILLRAFDFRVWMSALGAVMWAFSSYYFIIIAAGHIWKLLTLCFIPPTIAGMVLAYRGRYLWGVVVTGLFTALQILSNHVQMSYYFLLVMGLMSLAWLIQAVREGGLARWWRATLCVALGGVLGVCANLSNLYHTWQYSKESMRGKSELTHKVKDPADQTGSGLERSYITAWSYGIGETWSLLVPNVKGGASVPLSESPTAMAKANPDYAPIYQAFTQYFGEQPGTSGPVYVGAFVLMLFVLGLFVVRGPMKWCLLAATVLSVLLSWGKNFMWFTDLFLDYVPMYDKFRTVASILVIAEFTIPLLAMMALKKIVEDPRCLTRTNLGVSFGLTGGMALLFGIAPGLFFGQCVSGTDLHYLGQYAQAGYLPKELLGSIIANMSQMRQALLTADAFRSFIVVAVGALVVLAYKYGRINSVAMAACLVCFCLVDMWGVNKRYLNDGMFVRPGARAGEILPTEADELILQDKDSYHRVVNLTVSTFNDNTTSAHHKSVGGYHAAKLRRYQELIENHLQPEIRRAQTAAIAGGLSLDSVCTDTITPVLNMLNAKYFIMAGGDKNARKPVLNHGANGCAWMVGEMEYVPDADAEIQALHGLDTKRQAVADAKFQPLLGQADAQSRGTIRLTAYEPNALTYEARIERGGVAVFSEIYYPGWTCKVDGKEVPIGRANYVLRAIRLDEGEHRVEFSFHPGSIRATEAVAYASMGVLWLLVAALGFLSVKNSSKKKE